MDNGKEETDNCIRLERLIKTADGAVRVTFDKYFPPKQLPMKIIGWKTSISQARFINAAQYKILYSSGIVTSDDFDITLMVCLLRNYSTIPHPINGYDMLPLASETGPGADLARIKYYRNIFAHLGKERVPHAEFNDYWNDLSQAIIRLGGQDYERRCSDLRHARLITHCICQDSHQMEITSWEGINQVFVKTSIVDKIHIHLQNNARIVTIIGASGAGKSAIIHHLALYLRDSDNYFIVPCRSPRDIYSHFEMNRKFVFVLDDICGRYTVIQNDVEEWIRYEEIIKNILNQSSIKILVSVRTQVFEEEYFKKLGVFKNLVFDLSSPEHCLSNYEKIKIAKTYMPETDVQSIVEYMDKYPFFPLLCYIYKTRNINNAIDFFNNPFDIYSDELDKLKQEIDRTKYFSLFLLLVFDNHIKESSLIKPEYEEKGLRGDATYLEIATENETVNFKLKNILKSFGLHPYTRRDIIISHLDSMVNTYLVKTETYYKAVHDKVFDFICFHFGKSLPVTVLQYCSSKLICERTQLQSLDVDGFDNLILIQEQHESLYFDRIIIDILNGDVHIVMSNHQMQLQTYRSKLITFMNQNQSRDIEHILSSTARVGGEDQEPVTPLYLASQLGYLDLVSFMLDHISIKTDTKCYPLVAASYAGHVDIVCTFIQLGADVNRRDYSGHTPLAAACIGRHKDIVHILIENGAKLNQRSRRGHTPLMWACSGEYQGMVDLLVKHGADINVPDYSGKTSLMISRKLGNRKIIRSLIYMGADINQADNDGETPLIMACRQGQTDVVNFLIQKGADVNKSNSFGIAPLMLACTGQQKDIVSLLIKSQADVNIGDKFGRTALIYACENYYSAIFKELLFKADINKQDNFGTTPLIEASFRGIEEAVELLITYGASVNLCDNQEWTPLMSACDGAHVELAALLIDKNAEVNFKQKLTGITSLVVACKSYLKSTEDYINVNLPVSVNGDNTDIKGKALDSTDKNCELLIHLLLQNEADVVDAVTFAALNSCRDIIQLLIKFGIDLVSFCRQFFLQKDYYAETNVEVVRCLILEGCQVNAVDIYGMSSLSYACADEEEQYAHLLITNGADVNHDCSEIGTPLIIASINNSCNIADFLLSHGALINKQNSEGFTAFHVACANGFDEIVEVLLGYDCDICLPNNDGLSPLMTACVNKQEEVVQILVKYQDYLIKTINSAIEFSMIEVLEFLHETGVDLSAALLRQWKEKQGLEFLHYKYLNLNKCLNLACEWAENTLVEQLISLGANVNTNKGEPLLAACRVGSLEIVQFLVSNGADVNTQGNLCPLICAYKYRHYDVSDFLISKGADIDQALFWAVQERQLLLIRILADKKADINSRDQSGNSPLTLASSTNSKDVLSALIEIGADVNMSDENGLTPLVHACLSGNSEIVRLLIQSGADVEKPSMHEIEERYSDSLTPLLAACKKGYLEIVKLLFCFGADINNGEGDFNPLLCSYKNGHHDVSEYLISKSANLGQTLFWAIHERHIVLLRNLVDTGADINMIDRNGNSPLTLACSTNNSEVVAALLEIGADVNKSDEKGFTPLVTACLSRNDEIVRLLICNSGDMENALMFACATGQIAIIDILVTMGADINTRYKNGLTLLKLAQRNNQNETVEFLLSKGATRPYSCCHLL